MKLRVIQGIAPLSSELNYQKHTKVRRALSGRTPSEKRRKTLFLYLQTEQTNRL